MYTVIDLIITGVLTFLFTMFVCFFIIGVSIQSHEADAYREGYYKGFKVGRESKEE